MDNKINKKGSIAAIAILSFLVLCPAITIAQTQTFTGDTSRSTSGLGDYIAEFTYSLFSPSAASLDITIRNTTPSSTGGFLTGFLFNNPSNYITNVTLTSSNSFFSLIGGSSFRDTISATPFGRFDIGAAVGGNFSNTWYPSRGIGAGQSATFTFGLTGSNLNRLDTSSFIQAKTSTGDFFVSRFGGYSGGASDRVPGEPSQVTEPSGFYVLFSGLIGIIYTVRRTPYYKKMVKKGNNYA